MMARARTLGFEVVLVYIGTENVEINLQRIRQRVAAGGHDVPEADVRRRFRRSFDNLPLTAKRADSTLLFDNSSDHGYQLVGILSASAVQWFDPLPNWAAALRVNLCSELPELSAQSTIHFGEIALCSKNLRRYCGIVLSCSP